MLCLCLTMTAWAQEGVRFLGLSFREALEQAKAGNKWVFVDCYTSWCGPCRHMAEKVFTQKAAGDYFNSRFVCVKFDMEKGEGVELAKRLKVKAYPSFYLLRPDGTVRHKIVGGNELDEFIRSVERGLHEKTSFAYWNDRYDRGKVNRKPDLMACYRALAEAGETEKETEVFRKLWGQLTDKERIQKAYWPLYADRQCSLESPMWRFLLTHLADVRKNVGREETDRFLRSRYRQVLENRLTGRGREKIPFDELAGQLRLLNFPELDEMTKLAEWVEHRQVGQLSSYVQEKMQQGNASDLAFYASIFQGVAYKSRGSLPEEWSGHAVRLVQLTVEKAEREESALTVPDLKNYLDAFFYFQGWRISDLVHRVVTLSEKVLARFPDDKETNVVRQYINNIKKA